MLTITTFKWVPPFAQGYVRDIRLRWACEEAGLPYRVRLIDGSVPRSPEYLREQPFGQVPVLQDGDLSLFESGAILLHLGELSAKLLPKEAGAKARAISWVFAAMNSVEPFVQNFNQCGPDEARRPEVLATLKKRLSSLTAWMDGREFLESVFTIGDLMMICVLRELMDSEIMDEYPALKSYVTKGLARPGFQKALADQLKIFAENKPPVT